MSNKLLGLRRIECFPKIGTVEMSLASEQRRYTVNDLAERRLPEARQHVSDHIDIGALLGQERSRYRNRFMEDPTEEQYIAAGLTLDRIEAQEIQRQAERLAREYADEFAHDLEILVLKYITKI
jgi:hypothetical protein